VGAMSEETMDDAVTGDEETEAEAADALLALERRAGDFIRERPWACVLGAAGAGFVLARIVRGLRGGR